MSTLCNAGLVGFIFPRDCLFLPTTISKPSCQKTSRLYQKLKKHSEKPFIILAIERNFPQQSKMKTKFWLHL